MFNINWHKMVLWYRHQQISRSVKVDPRIWKGWVPR